MSTETRLEFAPNVVVGVGIVLLGIALILDRLRIVQIGTLLQFWPALLILFGASVVAQALRGGSDGRGQRPIVTPGFVFFLVIVGFLFSHVYQRSSVARSDTSEETVNLFSLMGRDNRTSHSTRFRGAELTSVMGGTTLDLREAMIAPGDEAVIDVFAMMGKVEVIVPDGWRVDIQTVPVMGRVRDRRWSRNRPDVEEPQNLPASPEAVTPEAPGPVTPAAPGAVKPETGTVAQPRVVLRGFVMMGGIDIRS